MITSSVAIVTCFDYYLRDQERIRECDEAKQQWQLLIDQLLEESEKLAKSAAELKKARERLGLSPSSPNETVEEEPRANGE